MKLTVASFLSDRIVDEILEALSSSHRKLVSVGVGAGARRSANSAGAGPAQWGRVRSLVSFLLFLVTLECIRIERQGAEVSSFGDLVQL